MLDILFAYPALAIASPGVLGLLVGSFLNVVILRLPARLEWECERDSRETLGLEPLPADAAPPDLVFKRSHCPQCGRPLSAWENIPLLSFLALRGRCRGCATPISWQYPAVEAVTGVLFALAIWQFGPTAQGLAALVFLGVLIAATGIDLRTMYLPDSLTLPLLWIGLLLSVVPVFTAPQDAIIGAAVGYLSLWSVYWGFKLLTGKEGMGYGDFKLLAAIGAWCGITAILPVLLMSSLLGMVIGVAMIVRQGEGQSVPFPFGPALAAAGAIQLLFGDRLLPAVLHLFGWT